MSRSLWWCVLSNIESGHVYPVGEIPHLSLCSQFLGGVASRHFHRNRRAILHLLTGAP